MGFYKERRNKIVSPTILKNTNVLILSTLNTNANVESQNMKKLPDTVAFLNKTKCGFSIVDQIADKCFFIPVSRK